MRPRVPMLIYLLFSIYMPLGQKTYLKHLIKIHENKIKINQTKKIRA